MNELKLGVVESRFADIIWQQAPLTTGELVKLAAAELNWKRTTTYTVLKRLCERGIFETEDGTVNVRISRQEFYAAKSEKFVEETFEGSLPAFLTAFGTRKKMSEAEINELKAIIENMRG